MNPRQTANTFHKPKTITPGQPSQSNHTSRAVAPKPNSKPKSGDLWSKKFELSFDIPKDYKAVMRRDYFTDSYVIIAPKRHFRPTDLLGGERKLVETAQSPRLDLQPEIDGIRDRQGNWKTMVVDNKFPALTLDNPEAFGKQEIVIDTPLPNVQLGQLDSSQIATVLSTYQKRTQKLLKITGIKYVTVFKNEGIRAGASLAHAHSQIFATPIVPPNIARLSQAIEQYFQKKKINPYDEVLTFERGEKSRIIFDNESFVAFCPFAPRWPLEAWIIPNKHITSIVDMDAVSITQLADILHKLVARLNKYGVDYNFYLENGVSPNHRFALKIQPRSISSWGGFEVATDTILNPIPPEAAASWYRAVR